MIKGDYYKRKAMASVEIEELLKRGVPKARMILRITRKYGFGSHFVEEQLELIEENILTQDYPEIEDGAQAEKPTIEEDNKEVDQILNSKPVGDNDSN